MLFIALINFEGKKFKESGTLVFKVVANNFGEALAKVNIKIESLNKEDTDYNHELRSILEVDEMEELE